MTATEAATAFKSSSRTFYHASRFFPVRIRTDLMTVCAFARALGEFSECEPQDRDGFEAFTDELWEAHRTASSSDERIAAFVELWKRVGFERSWVDAFVQASEADFDRICCRTLKEVEHHLYGSAEVLGLMIARILDLPEKSHTYVRSQARAFRYASMIRGLASDVALGRRYLPASELKRYGLSKLDSAEARSNESAFRLFMHAQISRYEKWQRQAETGYTHLPKRYRMAVEASSRLYAWSMERVKRDPLVVFERSVDPPLPIIIRETARSLV